MAEKKKALEYHREKPGKISVEPSVKLEDVKDLNLAYTPGVAEPCKAIKDDEEKAYEYTSKGNLVAVVSDGSAVLGLGDMGPKPSIPVMEGKANLMKKFGDVDGFPVCIDTDSPKEVIETVERIAPTLGAVNLEDIAAPECFEIEEELKQRLEIPVFHDDQHGTAIVVLAALKNALDLVDKRLEDVRIVISGAGASGNAVANFLIDSGAEEIIPVDSSGILRKDDRNRYKADLADRSAAKEESGSLADAMRNSDVFIGLSAPGIVNKEMVRSMNDDAIVFALANPEPEILPGKARDAGAEVTATGRSDFQNQVNNSLVFPGIFRGALDVRASEINTEMKIAASDTIRNFVEPRKHKIVPETLDKELAREIAQKVSKAAKNSGVKRF